MSPPNGIQSEPRLREVTWIERLAAASVALLPMVLCVRVVQSVLVSCALGGRILHLDMGLFQRLGQSMGNHRSLAALLIAVGYSLLDDLTASPA